MVVPPTVVAPENSSAVDAAEARRNRTLKVNVFASAAPVSPAPRSMVVAPANVAATKLVGSST